MAKFSLDSSREQHRLDERQEHFRAFGSGPNEPWYQRECSGFLALLVLLSFIGSAALVLICLKDTGVMLWR